MGKRLKRWMSVLLTAAMIIAGNVSVYAWDTNLYLYEPPTDGKGHVVGWAWVDANGDGIYECYYYSDNSHGEGYLQRNTVTPDGYTVNDKGQWTVDGAVQTRTKAEAKPGIDESIPYDPVHPLARAVDAFNLNLVETNYETGTVGTTKFAGGRWNVQALLTGQTDKYADLPADAPLVDGYYTWSDHGTDYYIAEEDYLLNKRNEQAIYEWMCGWLNSMDFEHMTEMEKAKAIAAVFAERSYDTEYANLDKQNVNSRDPVYAVLIDRKGICWEYAMTAMALAKAVGLKSTVFGSGNHACYFIQVDGLPYRGDNMLLQLGYSYYDYESTPDYIEFVSFID